MTDKEKELQAEAIGYYRKQIADLEKENAELKESLKKWKDAIYADVENYDDQLTKAKDNLTIAIGIIKRWYETNRSACIEPSQELIEVTEQFLKDSEV